MGINEWRSFQLGFVRYIDWCDIFGPFNEPRASKMKAFCWCRGHWSSKGRDQSGQHRTTCTKHGQKVANRIGWRLAPAANWTRSKLTAVTISAIDCSGTKAALWLAISKWKVDQWTRHNANWCQGDFVSLNFHWWWTCRGLSWHSQLRGGYHLITP